MQTASQLSEAVRESIKKKQAEREYNRLRGTIELLAKQNGGNVEVAISTFKQNRLKNVKEAPPELLKNLERIRKELVGGGTAEATA